MSQDSKKTAAKAADEKAQTTPPVASEAPDAQEKPEPERAAEVKTVPNAEKSEAPEKLPEAKTPLLKTVAAWAAEKRLAAWQTAALLRLKGWAEDKQIDENELSQALAAAIDLTLQIAEGGHEAIKLQVENRLRAMFQTPLKDLGVELLDINEDLNHSRLHYEALKSLGVKRVLVNSPAMDLPVPFGGLAVLESLRINSETVDE